MARYLLGRLAEILLVLLLMSLAIYLLIGLMPGDPIDLLIGANPRMTSADAARLRIAYGLDQPLWDRYLTWLGQALRGDFGFSRNFSQPVLAVIGPRLANTALLMLAGFALAVAIALPLGIWAAAKPHSRIDNAVNFLCFAGISIPAFWLALMLIMLFAVALGWLPASGTGGENEQPWSIAWLGDKARHLALPLLTLVIANIGHYTRYVRAAMIEVLRQDFVRTARAKGAGEPRVVWRHALGNALIPVITILALSFGSLFSGALITETMFAWPGMGKTIYDSILGNDYNLALIGLLFATLLTLLSSLIADLLYIWLDPRIDLK